MTTRETWRVVLAGGRVRNVVVTETQAGPEFIASCGAWSSRRAELAATPRGAIGALLWVTDWPVREILAPGEMTAAERMAVVTAERDDARMMSQCNRDNWRLAGEQRDALARAVAEYQSEVERIAAIPDAQEAAASLAAFCSALVTLDEALAVARGER